LQIEFNEMFDGYIIKFYLFDIDLIPQLLYCILRS